jgi:hypothetical protein
MKGEKRLMRKERRDKNTPQRGREIDRDRDR